MAEYQPDAEYMMLASFRGLIIAGDRIRRAIRDNSPAQVEIWWKEGIRHHSDAIGWASR